ncbi:hypothetical protein EAO72_15225 [Streptomyces sp. or43]|nr:hypothetical protein EAO72_15225 [Streptomyces sp. or43]
MLCQRVEVGADRGGARAARAAECGRRVRGEQDECGQVETEGELVEIPGRRTGGSQPGAELLGRGGEQDRAVRRGRRVEDRAHRMRGRHGGQRPGQEVTVGRVTVRHHDLGAETGQPVRQPRSRRQQKQVPRAERADGVDRRDCGEVAAAGDHDRRTLGQDGQLSGVLRHGRDEPRNTYLAVTQGELRFAGRESRFQRAQGGRLGVEIDEGDPPRVLRLGHPDQAPDGRRNQILHVVGAGGDGVVREDRQPGGTVRLVRGPGPQRGQQFARRRRVQQDETGGRALARRRIVRDMDGVAEGVPQPGLGFGRRGPARRRRRGTLARCGHRRPVGAEQPVVTDPVHPVQGPGGQWPQDDRVDGGHRGAGRIGQQDGETLPVW